jgi:hypothetical protein
MKLIGKFLVVLGIAAILPAGFVLVRDMSKAREHDTNVKNMTEERSEMREELHKVSLEYRGYQKSISSIPDSIRKATSGQILAEGREFTKRIRVMQQKDRELTRLMTRQGTMKRELLEGTRRFVGRIGGGGVALMVLGFVLVRLGGRRRLGG